MADAISLRRLRAQAVDAYKESGQTELLTYPEGEPDTVTIRDSDMDGLQPGQYLSDSIIDFYIKYLQKKTRLSSTDRDRFYFFNSFFFRKLQESSMASADSDKCRVDFGQLRKWTQGVDLFEKECIFIPVICRSHWTLILICHLRSLKHCRGSKPSPCIYHLDSISGRHDKFEGEMKSYLFEAWTDGRDVITKDEFEQMGALTCMRYVQVKVPHQDNEYDCGVYLLQYVEDILDALIASDELRREVKQLETYFARWDVSKVLKKRLHIKSLIMEMSGVQEITLYVKPYKNQAISKNSNEDLDRGGKAHTQESMKKAILVEEVAREDFEMVAQEDIEMERKEQHSNGGVNLDLSSSHPEGSNNIEQVELVKDYESDLERSHTRIEDLQQTTTIFKALNKVNEQSCAVVSPQILVNRDGRGWKWTQEATQVLLECMVKGDMFYKKSKRATDWKRISLEIMNRNKERPSDKQCRLRYDTLLKAYKVVKAYCEKTMKPFGEITDKERMELRLSTTLHENWYKIIEEVCNNMCSSQKSHKHMKRSPSIKERLPFGIETRITPMGHNNVVEGQEGLDDRGTAALQRSLEGNMHECEERRLRLKFKNKLDQPIFWGDMLTSEKEEELIVNLEDAVTGEIVGTGPEAFANLEVFLLGMGSTSNLDGTWTQQEFEEHIWSSYKLGGKLDMKLEHGEGLLGDVFVYQLMGFMGEVKLGVRVSPRWCFGFRVEEALTEAFNVLNAVTKYMYPPTFDSRVWTLQGISKGGSLHNFLNRENILTVEDLLRQKAMGIGYSNSSNFCIGTWKHAMTCKPSGKVRRYEHDGRGIVFNHLYEAIGLIEEDGGYRNVQSLSYNEKEMMKALIPEALRSWNHVELDEEHILPTSIPTGPTENDTKWELLLRAYRAVQLKMALSGNFP